MHDNQNNSKDYTPSYKFENEEELFGEEIELDEEDEAALDRAWAQVRREKEMEARKQK